MQRLAVAFVAAGCGFPAALAGEEPVRLQAKMMAFERDTLWKKFNMPAPCLGAVVPRLHNRTLRVGDALTLELEIHNVCEGCRAEIRPGSYVRVSDDVAPGDNVDLWKAHFAPAGAHLQDGIPCRTKETIVVQMEARQDDRSVEALPPRLRIKVEDATGMETAWGYAIVEFPFHAYRPMFHVKRPFWMLLVGFPGVGKTTIIMNTASAILPGPVVLKPKDRAPRQGHNTRQITVYDLAEITGDSDVQIKMVDTWGICEGNTCTSRDFSTSFLESLAAGAVPVGFSLSEYDAAEGSFSPKDGQRLVGTRMDAIVFVVSTDLLHKEDTLELAKKYIGQIQDLGYPTLVVVTKLHLECEESTSQCEADLLRRTAAKFEIPPHMVKAFTRSNVSYEDVKDSITSKYALGIMQEVLQQQEQFTDTPDSELPQESADHWETSDVQFAVALILGAAIMLLLFWPRPASSGTEELAQLAAQQPCSGGVPQDGQRPAKTPSAELPAAQRPASAPEELAQPRATRELSTREAPLLSTRSAAPLAAAPRPPPTMMQRLLLSDLCTSMRRRREVEAQTPWLPRFLLQLIFVGSLVCLYEPGLLAGVVPPRWEIHVGIDCSRTRAALLGPGESRSTEAECQARCLGLRECRFFAHIAGACSMFSTCPETKTHPQARLFALHRAKLWQVAPQILASALTALDGKLSGVAFALSVPISVILDVELWNVLPAEAFCKVIGLQLFTLLLVASVWTSLLDGIRRVEQEERDKPERRKQLERQVQEEVRGLGRTARRKNLHAALFDIVAGGFVVGALAVLIYFAAQEVGGQRLNLANFITQLGFGVSFNGGMRVLISMAGLSLFGAPLCVGLQRTYGGFKRLAHDPDEDLTNAVMTVASQAYLVETYIRTQLEALFNSDQLQGVRSPGGDHHPEADMVAATPDSSDSVWATPSQIYTQFRHKEPELALQHLEIQVERRSRQRAVEFAMKLKEDPEVVFNHESLLHAEAAAFQGAMDRGMAAAAYGARAIFAERDTADVPGHRGQMPGYQFQAQHQQQRGYLSYAMALVMGTPVVRFLVNLIVLALVILAAWTVRRLLDS